MNLTEIIAEEVTNAFYAHEGEFPDQLEHKTAAAITTRLHECVKPLKWRMTTTGYDAKSIVGKYEVYASIMSDVWLWRDENNAALDQYQGKEADDEAAKAAAQAHYAEQIIEGFNL